MASLPPGSYEPAIDIDQHTESNHDTALTLAAAGGHDELVELLLAHGSNIEHRDKKGRFPVSTHSCTFCVRVDLLLCAIYMVPVVLNSKYQIVFFKKILLCSRVRVTV